MFRQQSESIVVTNALTIFSTFLMGWIDAYTFLEQSGSFASAQTGNLVTFSVKIFSGDFADSISHIAVFGGFALGAFLGEALIKRFQRQKLYKTRLILFLQTILLGFLALFQADLNGTFMLVSLGLLAGYELTVFRKFRETTVNNGIMTGNTKNLMTHLYKGVFDNDKRARRDFFHIFIIITVFLLGAGVGALILQLNEWLNLWGAFLLVLISLFVTLVTGTVGHKDRTS